MYLCCSLNLKIGCQSISSIITTQTASFETIYSWIAVSLSHHYSPTHLPHSRRLSPFQKLPQQRFSPIRQGLDICLRPSAIWRRKRQVRTLPWLSSCSAWTNWRSNFGRHFWGRDKGAVNNKIGLNSMIANTCTRYSLNHLVVSPGVLFEEGLDSLFEVYVWIENVGLDGFSEQRVVFAIALQLRDVGFAWVWVAILVADWISHNCLNVRGDTLVMGQMSALATFSRLLNLRYTNWEMF